MVPIFLTFLIEILQEIFLVIIFIITRIKTSKSSILEPESEHRPSPLLVPVPAHSIVNSTKANLTVSKYGDVIARASETCDDNNCVICLSVMEKHDEVRVLPNCRHVFHKGCIDAWIDKCKTSCPVCRSGLLPGRVGKLEGGEDSWRRERMMYLFGEDFLFYL
ncbi:E3 ubiquitin-protein ligase atl41 [Phtheirospermum japonicum]|uniref:E3 ubiquitin-protein ligase atl41 n=1 Tax=Phtheirospermum japonicum TaxID=374723 RepID=A0A830CEQ6_9LAMI|nr:E3 ubiquitin-protein ligase atl41 [Phtheirospermum japonicum]